MDENVRIALIYGSTRQGRFCDVVAGWVGREIADHDGFVVEKLDPATDMPGDSTVGARVASADAFVVVTPEYNHGYPAPLKAFIDSFGAEWHAKPVAFVSYGGVSGGLRAVEQLRQVFAELHAVTVRDSVSFAGAWQLFGANGDLKEPDRYRRSFTEMLGRLRWWAVALRNARKVAPYEQAA